MEREAFKPEINKELDIQFTAIMEIAKGKKEATVNAVLQKFADEETENLTVQALAEYAASKKADPDSAQWAREEIVRKVVGGKL